MNSAPSHWGGGGLTARLEWTKVVQRTMNEPQMHKTSDYKWQLQYIHVHTSRNNSDNSKDRRTIATPKENVVSFSVLSPCVLYLLSWQHITLVVVGHHNWRY